MLTENFPLHIVGVKRDCRIDAPPYLNDGSPAVSADDYLGALFRGCGNDDVGEGDDEQHATGRSATNTDTERSSFKVRQRRNSYCGAENENDSSGRFVASTSSSIRLQLEERLTTYLMAPALGPNQENEDPTEPFRQQSWPAPGEEAPSYAMDAFRPVKGSPLKRKLRLTTTTRSDAVDSPVRMDSFSGEADLPAQEWQCPPTGVDDCWGEVLDSASCYSSAARSAKGDGIRYLTRQQQPGSPEAPSQQQPGRRYADLNRLRPSILERAVQCRWLSSSRFESCSDLWLLAKAMFVLSKFHCSKCGDDVPSEQKLSDADFLEDPSYEDAAVALVSWDALKVEDVSSDSAVSRGWPPRSVDGTTADMSTLKATFVLLAFISYLQETESQRKPDPNENGSSAEKQVPFSSTLNILAAALSFQGQLNHQLFSKSASSSSHSPPSSILANNTSSLYASCCTLPGFNLYTAAGPAELTARPGKTKTLRSSNCSNITTITTASTRSSKRRLSLSTTSSRGSHALDSGLSSDLDSLNVCPGEFMALKIDGLKVGGLKVGGPKVDGLKVDGLKVGGLKVGGLKVDGAPTEDGETSPSSSFFSSSPSQIRRVPPLLSQTAPALDGAHRASESLPYSSDYLAFVRGQKLTDSWESEKDSSEWRRPSSSSLDPARQTVPLKQFAVWKGRCARLLLEVKSGTQRSLQPLTHRFSQYIKSNGSAAAVACPGQNGSVKQTTTTTRTHHHLKDEEQQLAAPQSSWTSAQTRLPSEVGEPPAVVCQARDCGAILAMIQRFCCALFVASAWIDEQEPLSTAVLSDFLGNAFSVLDGLKPCLQQGSVRSWSSTETISETVSSKKAFAVGSMHTRMTMNTTRLLPYTSSPYTPSSPNFPNRDEASLCPQSNVVGSKTAQLKKFAAATASSLYSSVTSSCLSRGGESFLIRDSLHHQKQKPLQQQQKQQQRPSKKNVVDLFGPNGSNSACVICADTSFSHFGQPAASHHLGKDTRFRGGKSSSDRPNASPGLGIIPGRETAVKRFGATSIDFERNLFCLLASIHYRLQICPQTLRIVRRNMLKTLAVWNPSIMQP